MTYTTGFVCLISTASDRSKKSKNGLGRCGASSRHITKLEQSIYFRYLCFYSTTLFWFGPGSSAGQQHQREAVLGRVDDEARRRDPELADPQEEIRQRRRRKDRQRR
jgi:hypothetical protein